MKSTPAVLALVGLVAVPLGAEAQNRRRQGIPPGHMPPPGMCRVWYEGEPPGHQPPPTSCREAERVAARDGYARVIYGGDARDRDDRWGGERDRSRDRYPGSDPYPYPDRSGYPSAGRYPQGRYPDAGGGYNDVPYSNGFDDGYEKGLDDARANRQFDPTRQGRYRSADRGYDKRYGTKDAYKAVYRDGFRAGYDEGYRDSRTGSDPNRRGGGAIGGAIRRLPWPF